MMLPPKVIVSPIDFSTHSNDALGTAADLASRFGSEVCLVHVVPAIPKLPSARTIFKEAEYELALHADAEKQLGQMAEALARRGIAAKFVVGTANDTSMEILRLAEENRADLIVIATHGMTGWHKLAFGSVTEKLVRLATSPVLVLRARPEGEAGDTSGTQNSVAVAR
jgi:nucleotide-binding universal stress UspA family protein